MAKLHELLAAESSVAAAYNTIAAETLKVFGKPDHFTKQTESISYFDEGDKKLDQSATKDNVTTVDERINYTFGRAFSSYIDLLAQKDRTNQTAKADVIVNGQVIIKDAPATSLLTLEARLGESRKQLEAIPTLQPGPVWIEDKSESMWKVEEPTVTFRTKKTMRPVVLVPATPQHPAQVEKIMEDVPVAKIEKVTWSGMWTSKQKSDALARLDALTVAVKKARQRANRADVVPVQVGGAIAKFILTGPESEALTGVDTE
jgi:hypothetical protein